MTYALDNNSTVNLNGAASFLLTAASMPTSFGHLIVNGGAFTKTFARSNTCYYQW